MPDTERVTQATLLGIDITSTQSVNCCVRKQDATANKPAFIPLVTAQVARHGSIDPTSVIYWSYYLRYALPAFAGQLTVDDRDMISAISRKALRRGVTHTAFDIEEIIDNFDRKLFSKITNSGHCLHHLLPPKTCEHCSYSRMKRKHYYQLPNAEFSLYKNCFINRCLFKFR